MIIALLVIIVAGFLLIALAAPWLAYILGPLGRSVTSERRRFFPTICVLTCSLLFTGASLITAIPFSATSVAAVGAKPIGGAEEASRSYEGELTRIQQDLGAPVRVDLYLSGTSNPQPTGLLQESLNFNPSYETYGGTLVATPTAIDLLLLHRPGLIDASQAKHTLDEGGALVVYPDERVELRSSYDPAASGETLITPRTASAAGMTPRYHGSLFAGGKRVSLLRYLQDFDETKPLLVSNASSDGMEIYFLMPGLCSLLIGLTMMLVLVFATRRDQWRTNVLILGISIFVSTIALLGGIQLLHPGWVPTWELGAWWLAVILLFGVPIGLRMTGRR